MTENRLVISALPYINNLPHLGHIVGSHLPADIFARYCRLKGYNTLFIGGSDENGAASEIEAEKLNIDLKTFSDTIYLKHKKVYDWFNISYDNFSRTSSSIHHETTREFFKVLHSKGLINEKIVDSFFSPTDNRFLSDRYVKGECAKCGFESANGDQCEKCSAVLDVFDLKNPKSTLSGGDLELRKTKHLFFSLDKFSDELKEWISTKEWSANVKNLALSWIKEGLKERSISRDLQNGVSIPLDGFNDKVFYVWFDAPIGYISSTKEVSKDWEFFWKDKSIKTFNFMGKDNIPFHTIFWPAMLMGHGELNLPTEVVGLQYLTYEKEKFSKSKKIGVFCDTLPNMGLPADVWRSYLIRVMPESKDSEFKWDDFMKINNSDLVGNLGNFVNRVMTFSTNNLGGALKKPKELTEDDKKLSEELKNCVKNVENYLEKIEIRKAYAEILHLCDLGNKYIEIQQPWKILTDNKRRANDIFFNCCVLLNFISVLASPFIPETCVKIRKYLGINKKCSWNDLDTSLISEFTIEKFEILFKKIEDEDLKKYQELSSQVSELKDFF